MRLARIVLTVATSGALVLGTSLPALADIAVTDQNSEDAVNDATKNHVDGLGSNIVFEFRTVGGVKKLVVSAYVVNDSFWVNNPAYRLGAQNNWAKFAWNLNNTTIIT